MAKEHKNDNEGCECLECVNGPGAIAAKVEEGIQAMGWVVVPIIDANFVYTVGLTETYNHPEFIIIGFPPRIACNIVGEAVEKLKQDREAFRDQEVGGVIQVRVHGELQPSHLGCRRVMREKKLDLLCRAVARYGEDGFEAKQLIFPDMHGVLPWQPGFNQEWGQCQPALYDLDENGK